MATVYWSISAGGPSHFSTREEQIISPNRERNHSSLHGKKKEKKEKKKKEEEIEAEDEDEGCD